jgi:hypothetical protein
MSGTRTIKDSLFVALFNHEEAARELFNAIYGSDYGPETPIKMTTLEDVLYRGIKNDVSFTVAEDIYMALFEQQSSFSRNVPLRILLYIARGYERLIPNREVHKDKPLKIPRPCPVVLYTGRDSARNAMEQDRVTLCLSDAFKGEPNPFGSLELEVLVLNITPGHNEELLRRAPRLRGYMDFITRLREQERTMPRVEAVLAALDWCVSREILADFFREHRTEVSNMILNELTNADAIEAVREETREATWEEASKAIWEEARQHWEEASKVVREETSKVVREETSKAVREEERRQMFELIDQGLTGEQLKQALLREVP